MTKIGAACLITIGLWIVVELAVQFGGYGHSCSIGAGRHGSMMLVMWQCTMHAMQIVLVQAGSYGCSIGAGGQGCMIQVMWRGTAHAGCSACRVERMHGTVHAVRTLPLKPAG